MCCDNCGHTGSDGPKECTGCRAVRYCNRTCQKAHWKQHKFFCRVAQATLQQTNCSARLLLQKWGTQQNVLALFMQDHIGRERLYEIGSKKEQEGEEEEVVVFKLRFHYNERTFLPIEPPFVVPLGQLEDRYISEQHKETFKSKIRKVRENPGEGLWISRALEFQRQTPASFGVSLLLEGTDQGVLFPYSRIFAAQVRRNPDMEASLACIKSLFSLRMDEPLFLTWNPLKQEYLTFQVNKLAQHESYEPFLLNTLRAGTDENLHTTHIVQVDLELGFELGEISNLECFKLKPASEIIAWIDKQPDSYQSTLQVVKRCQLDLTGSPYLLRQRAQRRCPSLVMATVVFRNWEQGVFLANNIFWDANDLGATTVADCDSRAQEAFGRLQRAALPRVLSPLLP